MVTIIDNYDSFVHNIARYFRQCCDDKIVVVRNDEINLDDPLLTEANAIVISPGPCDPTNAGISIPVVKRFCKLKPILGVCLGHQAIVCALGGGIVRDQHPMHGKSSSVIHNQDSPLFDDVPRRFVAGRYHSLIAQGADLPTELKVLARTEQDEIMAVQFEDSPVFGLQFHPESVLTDCGYQLVGNFLRISGVEIRESTFQVYV